MIESSSIGPTYSVKDLNKKTIRWESKTRKNEWLIFKFTKPVTIKGLRVVFPEKSSTSDVDTAFSPFKNYKIEKLMENSDTISKTSYDKLDWTVIKDGVGIKQECCFPQDIKFPQAHGNMFRLYMFDSWYEKYNDPVEKGRIALMTNIKLHFLEGK